MGWRSTDESVIMGMTGENAMLIYIVEDEPVIRRELKVLLENAMYASTESRNR